MPVVNNNNDLDNTVKGYYNTYNNRRFFSIILKIYLIAIHIF